MTATGLTRSHLNPAEIQSTNCIHSCESLCLLLPGLNYTGPLSKKAHFPLWIGMICLLRQEALSPSLPPPSLAPFVVTAAGLVSYACWSCSFVKGRCYNLCDLPLCCLLWQSWDGRKCLEYFWQKKKNIYISQVQERIQWRMLACFALERRKINHTLQCPHPQSKNHLYNHIGIL